MSNKTRLEHLRAMIEGAEDRMLRDECSDQNYTMLGRMRHDFLVQVEALDPSMKTQLVEDSAVDVFSQRRKKRSAS